jgi:hypothetical protein
MLAATTATTAAAATLDVGIDQDADRFEPSGRHSRLGVAQRFKAGRFAAMRQFGNGFAGIRRGRHGVSTAASIASSARPAANAIGFVVIFQIVIKRCDFERIFERIVDFGQILGDRAVLASGATAASSASATTGATRFIFRGTLGLRFGNQAGAKTGV